jgi:hypothetical protein
LLLALGCAGGVKYEGAIGAGGPITNELSVSAQDMNDVVVEALQADSGALQIASSTPGAIETSWEEHAGSTHGIWFWKKIYLARTKYTIRFSPAISEPTSRCVVEIYWNSEERPNEKYPWESANLDFGEGRCLDLMKGIKAVVQGRVIGGDSCRFRSYRPS